jgi:hypothetical protein
LIVDEDDRLDGATTPSSYTSSSFSRSSRHSISSPYSSTDRLHCTSVNPYLSSETSRSPRVQTTTCFRAAFGRLAGRLGYNQAFPSKLGSKRKTNPQAARGLSVPEQSFIVRLGRGLRSQGAKAFHACCRNAAFGSPLAKICLAS